jgi:hypothetical protein
VLAIAVVRVVLFPLRSTAYPSIFYESDRHLGVLCPRKLVEQSRRCNTMGFREFAESVRLGRNLAGCKGFCRSGHEVERVGGPGRALRSRARFAGLQET